MVHLIFYRIQYTAYRFSGLGLLERPAKSFTKGWIALLLDKQVQHLILPFHHNRLEIGYKNQEYQRQRGFIEYGWTIASAEDRCFSLGEGKVLLTGNDHLLGPCLFLYYPAPADFSGRRFADISVLFCGLQEFWVNQGQTVTKETPLGKMEKRGKKDEYRLHIQMNTDPSHFYCLPGIIGKSNLVERGEDHTVNPSQLLSVGDRGGRAQTFQRKGMFSEPYDIVIPNVEFCSPHQKSTLLS